MSDTNAAIEGDDVVVPFTGETTLPYPPDEILSRAMGELTDVVLIGWDNNGDLDVRSSTNDLKEVLWLLEQAKLFIIRTGGNDG